MDAWIGAPEQGIPPPNPGSTSKTGASRMSFSRKALHLLPPFTPSPRSSRRDKMKERRGIDIKYFIVTSDEKNSTWWDDVDNLGWLGMDHTRIRELYGRWYPYRRSHTIHSSGFVGTVSVLARRRNR
ncbi:hypothetical protein B0H12DRAFT_763206 [Mycena haematopus]|nr:hypothetical protein B0H12DRAFT_763206 [Mycena haematopus]